MDEAGSIPYGPGAAHLPSWGAGGMGGGDSVAPPPDTVMRVT